MANWKEFTRSRRIALVGGHDAVDWDYVRSFDLIVRLNNHWKRQGGRCDVLYYSCANDLGYDDKTVPELKERGLRWAWLNLSHQLFNSDTATYPKIKRDLDREAIINGTYLHGPAPMWNVFTALQNMPTALQWPKELAQKYDFYPLTGVLALYHLTLTNALQIYVTGMNFYSQDGQLPERAGCHHVRSNLEVLRDIWQKDYRIELDDQLLSII